MSCKMRRPLNLAGLGSVVARAISQPPHSRPLLPVQSNSLFSTSPTCDIKQMPSRPKHPPESDMEEAFVKGSGPGGQKINKTNSAVQIKHIPTGIVVKCQATRSRDQNRKIARDLLATRLDDLHNGDQSRTAIVGEHKRKKYASASKKSKRKYRKLEEEKAEAEAESGDTADADPAPSTAHPGLPDQPGGMTADGPELRS